jgi:hypothetical protein
MKKVLATLALALTTTMTFAQDTPLEITGSVDTYYKYDFSGNANIPTSFADEQNSLSLGMIDIALSKTTGKTSFVGELSYGPRSVGSIPLSGFLAIQNLYVTYAATDKLSLTAGYMGTFVGYEVISPAANFHYSTSYLFTNGPFQNAGIKANYAISDKVGIMAGLFSNEWNEYSSDPAYGLNTFGAQLSLAPSESVSAYINFATGSVSGTILDLTASFALTEKFSLGLNAADFTAADSDNKAGYTGVALYPAYAINDNFGLGLRGEYFSWKELSGDYSTTAFTLSANLKSGGLTFIPELRLDSASKDVFNDKDSAATGSATQFAMGVVYGF